MTDIPDNRFTYEDHALRPKDGKRHEIIAGWYVISSPPPVWQRRIAMRLSSRLHTFVEERDLGVVLSAPTDVLLSRRDVLQPDILFVSKARSHILKQWHVLGTPDLVVEILSTATWRLDEDARIVRYELFGLREYWIVDPFARRVHVFVPSGNRLVRKSRLSATNVLITPMLPGFKVRLRELFRV